MLQRAESSISAFRDQPEILEKKAIARVEQLKAMQKGLIGETLKKKAELDKSIDENVVREKNLEASLQAAVESLDKTAKDKTRLLEERTQLLQKMVTMDAYQKELAEKMAALDAEEAELSKTKAAVEAMEKKMAERQAVVEAKEAAVVVEQAKLSKIKAAVEAKEQRLAAVLKANPAFKALFDGGEESVDEATRGMAAVCMEVKDEGEAAVKDESLSRA
ncbi:hypothetical protein CkaCkLH20_04416 [Colletotrichum karsti]|uniref:Uncharacterized protein n=1 Tax=Colletotrichum karsti TaxID=1095194 RepID=A0A9P6IFN8_9PEZI|nr:uncharacterized protein CkaCkLH20_04416 [Colletotrichum karsti]KAF9877840.1 hypothetical protein CkaCkLH20_04416 [Colletotrichum karsti]